MKSHIAKILLPLAFAGFGVFAVAAPAQAAATCNNKVNISKGALYATYPAYNSSGTCVMGKGNSGVAVRTLQGALNTCYHAGLVVDGIFGQNTFEALKDAQDAAGVTDDGIYGPTTAGAIKFPYKRDSDGSSAGCQSRY
ncbi:peptidoglycan-binding domain-containing protein [Virgisporangium aurantiacum]|uniref:Peptidoglycan binding-like domain-containing protein n=1 Tax=Virgisporangium aurantiacum TaxID=175570 RepID=A0A8J3ZJ26_9ACTN|nr:peptidoglycan-binding domain-containing protein [Virgisporangium aurantiacum]GIJ63693.1 hypothetical protein Vau01_112090 [Virgisporangium aurantiacum]